MSVNARRAAVGLPPHKHHYKRVTTVHYKIAGRWMPVDYIFECDVCGAVCVVPWGKLWGSYGSENYFLP